MKDFEKQIQLLDKEVNRYYSLKELNGNELNDIARKMVAILHYLTTVRAEMHDAFQNFIFESTKDKGMSVARAENEAHVTYPAMYLLRHKLDSAYEVVGMIRTNISYLKSEMTNRID